MSSIFTRREASALEIPEGGTARLKLKTYSNVLPPYSASRYCVLRFALKVLIKRRLDHKQPKNRQGLVRELVACFIQKASAAKRSREFPKNGPGRDVCPSASDWVPVDEALDPYGHTVKVLDVIPYNGTLVKQYFYETFCVSPESVHQGSVDHHPELTSKVTGAIGETNVECLAVDKTVKLSLRTKNFFCSLT